VISAAWHVSSRCRSAIYAGAVVVAQLLVRGTAERVSVDVDDKLLLGLYYDS